MPVQTNHEKCLGESPAGGRFSRLCSLALAVTLFTSGAAAGLGQVPVPAQPDAAKPAPAVAGSKPATGPAAKIVGGYMVHQALEVGGQISSVAGSPAMWATLVNQGSGARILNQSLEMHSVDTSRTPFFDTLTTSSFGYGGDPIDVSRLRVSKGRWYDFNGSFRRYRQYFDYNLLDNSLLGPQALVPEPDSLHLFNTVRRETNTNLTVLPLSSVSFRAGFNEGTNEGPTLSTLHGGGDVQLNQWWQNSSITYSGGVDWKFAPRTVLSYDQFYVYYKGDTTFSLTGADWLVRNGKGLMESLGVDLLSTSTCGTGANKTAPVVNGVANPYCSGTTVQTQSAPTRTSFPTEQLRFSSHYWDKVFMNGRFLYSGAVSNVNSFNETFVGLVTRTYTLQEIDTGGLANGAMAHNKRVDINADYSIIAELSKYFSVSDTFDYWDFRVPGSNSVTSNVWAGTATTPNLNILTPLSAVTLSTTTTPTQNYLNQKISSNTLMANAAITPEVRLSGGWLFKVRNITDSGQDDLTWNINGAILGIVVQPSRMVRVNVDYDAMNSKSSNAMTPSNTYTREAPNASTRLSARATIKPANWISLAVTGIDYTAKNDDPLVNHFEHYHDVSFATTMIAGAGFSFDFNFAHDSFFSVTDLCYVYTATATAPLPPGAINAGTCVYSPTNPDGAPNLYLGNGYYNVPTNFISASVNYSPSKYFRLNAGLRSNETNGQAEMLNPYMVPGALQSKYNTPYTDLQINIAPQWTWHGNWTRDAYAETGPVGLLPTRNTSGDIVTLGVRYAF